jgi:hypothetical protein
VCDDHWHSKRGERWALKSIVEMAQRTLNSSSPNERMTRNDTYCQFDGLINPVKQMAILFDFYVISPGKSAIADLGGNALKLKSADLSHKQMIPTD